MTLTTKQIDKLIKLARASDKINGITLTPEGGLSNGHWIVLPETLGSHKDYALTVAKAGAHHETSMPVADLLTPILANDLTPLTLTPLTLDADHKSPTRLGVINGKLIGINGDYVALMQEMFGASIEFRGSNPRAMIGIYWGQTLVAALMPMRIGVDTIADLKALTPAIMASEE